MDKLFLFFGIEIEFNTVRILKSTHIKFTDTNLILISCSTFHVTWFLSVGSCKNNCFQASFKIHIIASYCLRELSLYANAAGIIFHYFKKQTIQTFLLIEFIVIWSRAWLYDDKRNVVEANGHLNNIRRKASELPCDVGDEHCWFLALRNCWLM